MRKYLLFIVLVLSMPVFAQEMVYSTDEAKTRFERKQAEIWKLESIEERSEAVLKLHQEKKAEDEIMVDGNNQPITGTVIQKVPGYRQYTESKYKDGWVTEMRSYGENGILKTVGTYKGNQKYQGIEYYDSGDIFELTIYAPTESDPFNEAERTVYYRSGAVKYKETKDEQKEVIQGFYRDGNVAFEAELKKGVDKEEGVKIVFKTMTGKEISIKDEDKKAVLTAVGWRFLPFKAPEEANELEGYYKENSFSKMNESLSGHYMQMWRDKAELCSCLENGR